MGGRVPALDGLRGVAIGGVLIYHLGVLPGGHLGVTVFLVLSGYLITRLLLEEHERTGKLDLRSFYSRRAARLLPALALLLPVHMVVWAPAWDVRALLLGLLPLLLYCFNLSRALFGPVLGLGWAWSLSLEEQFYGAWPTVVRRCRPARLVGIAIAVFLGAVGLRVALTVTLTEWWSLVYFLPFTRMDALLAGCLAALWAYRGGRLPRPELVAIVAAAVVALCYVAGSRDGQWTYLVGLPVIEVAAAVLILALVAAPASLMTSCLSVRPLVHVGVISYGLYLWNSLPLDALALYGSGRPMGFTVLGLVCLGVTFVAAESSWRWVERPAIAWNRRRLFGSSRKGSVKGRTGVSAEPIVGDGVVPGGVAP